MDRPFNQSGTQDCQPCARVNGVDDVKKLRMLNLVRPNYRSGEPGKATVPTSKARALVTASLQKELNDAADYSQRPDMRDRVQAAKAWLEAVEKEDGENEGGEGGAPMVHVVGRCGMLGRAPPGHPCIEAVGAIGGECILGLDITKRHLTFCFRRRSNRFVRSLSEVA